MDFKALVHNKAFIATVGIGAVIAFFMTRSSKSASMALPTADPSLVALSVNAGLERDKLSASKEIALATLGTQQAINQSNNNNALDLVKADFANQQILTQMGDSLETTKLGFQAKALADNNQLARQQLEIGATIARENNANSFKLENAKIDAGLQQLSKMFDLERIRLTFADLAGVRQSEVDKSAINASKEIGIAQTNASLELGKLSAQAQVDAANAAARGQIDAAKASKSKGISCCGWGLSW